MQAEVRSLRTGRGERIHPVRAARRNPANCRTHRWPGAVMRAGFRQSVPPVLRALLGGLRVLSDVLRCAAPAAPFTDLAVAPPAPIRPSPPAIVSAVEVPPDIPWGGSPPPRTEQLGAVSPLVRPTNAETEQVTSQTVLCFSALRERLLRRLANAEREPPRNQAEAATALLLCPYRWGPAQQRAYLEGPCAGKEARGEGRREDGGSGARVQAKANGEGSVLHVSLQRSRPPRSPPTWRPSGPTARWRS